MAGWLLSQVTMSCLLVAASLAAPMTGSFGGGGGYAGATFDLGSLSFLHAPGGFVGRFGEPHRDVLLGGVESEGFRRVGVGADSSRRDEATLAGFQTPEVGRQAFSSHDAGVQERDAQEAGPRDFGQLEAGPQDIGPREIRPHKDVLHELSPHAVGPSDIGPQQINKKTKIPNGEGEARVIGVNYAGGFHGAGIPWRNCVSAWDPRCRRPTAQPNLWFLL